MLVWEWPARPCARSSQAFSTRSALIEPDPELSGTGLRSASGSRTAGSGIAPVPASTGRRGPAGHAGCRGWFVAFRVWQKQPIRMRTGRSGADLAGRRASLQTSGGVTVAGPAANPRFFTDLAGAEQAAAGLLAVANVAQARYYQPQRIGLRDPVVTCRRPLAVRATSAAAGSMPAWMSCRRPWTARSMTAAPPTSM